MTEQKSNPWRLRFHSYDMILVMAGLSLFAALLPDGVYLSLRDKAQIKLDSDRAAAMLKQFRLFAPIMSTVGVVIWWVVRKRAAEIRALFAFESKIVSLLLQLHLFIFIPTVAYWFFYAIYRLKAPQAQWQQEMKVVPWHNDLPDALSQLRREIPPDASLLLILEQPGTISYAAFFNSYLYPRKVYIYRRESTRGRVTRADVNLDDLRSAGIGWILTYSGPREFTGELLTVERIQ